MLDVFYGESWLDKYKQAQHSCHYKSVLCFTLLIRPTQRLQFAIKQQVQAGMISVGMKCPNFVNPWQMLQLPAYLFTKFDIDRDCEIPTGVSSLDHSLQESRASGCFPSLVDILVIYTLIRNVNFRWI